MTVEEAHSAFLSHTSVKIMWSPLPGEIIMIGYKRDGKTVAVAIEDGQGLIRIAYPEDIKLANPDDWNPHAARDAEPKN